MSIINVKFLEKYSGESMSTLAKLLKLNGSGAEKLASRVINYFYTAIASINVEKTDTYTTVYNNEYTELCNVLYTEINIILLPKDVQEELIKYNDVLNVKIFYMDNAAVNEANSFERWKETRNERFSVGYYYIHTAVEDYSNEKIISDVGPFKTKLELLERYSKNKVYLH